MVKSFNPLGKRAAVVKAYFVRFDHTARKVLAVKEVPDDPRYWEEVERIANELMPLLRQNRRLSEQEIKQILSDTLKLVHLRSKTQRKAKR